MFEAFQKGTPLIDIGDIKQGLATADNNRFLRQWFEVNNFNINFSCESCVESKNSNLKWYPYNKGGDFKKWYGNQNYVVNWLNDGYEIRNFRNSSGKLKSRPQNSNFYFHESLGWSSLTSGNIGFRFYPKGFLFDTKGSSVFIDKNKFNFIFAFLNSSICQCILDILAPTIDYSVGSVSILPLIFDHHEYENKIGIYLLLLK